MDNIDSLKPEFFTLDRSDQIASVEALIFSAEEPVNLETLFNMLIADVTERTNEETQKSIQQELTEKFGFGYEYISDIVDEINTQLSSTGRPYRIVDYAGGFQFATKPEYGELLQRLVRAKTKRRLSRAALEALSIIAYNQPVSKPEIEQIRGINSNEVVNSLIDKKLVEPAGRSEGLGKPLLYRTTPEFLIQFGLSSLESLPKLKEVDELIENNEELKERSDEYMLKKEEGEEETGEIENGIPKILNGNNGVGKNG